MNKRFTRTVFFSLCLAALLLALAPTPRSSAAAHLPEKHSSTAHAAGTDESLTYYGVDLQKMALATGVDPQQPGTIAPNSPWPQNASNYCFTAVVQAIVNYNDLTHNLPMRYPHQNDEGPTTGNPDDEVPGQILYDSGWWTFSDGEQRGESSTVYPCQYRL